MFIRPASKKRKFFQQKDRTLLVLLGSLVLLLAGGMIGYAYAIHTEPIFVMKRVNDKGLVFTNPLLSCGISENKEFSEYKPLEETISSSLDEINQDGKTTASVYYRDLNTGRWFGINENEKYSPASLFKVPIMISYLKESESDPYILEKRTYFSGKSDISNTSEHFKDMHSIQANTSYSIGQLLSYMIKYSDNLATTLLFKGLDQNSFGEVISDIGLQPLNTTGTVQPTDDFITVKEYSYLFRLLYNATYLSPENSEKALKMLSEADFDKGITLGLPKGLKAAHKFGERSILDPATLQDEKNELHDCGVVYYPGHPYLICVMTKGKDFDTLSKTIGTTSKIIYEYVDKEYKSR